MGGEPWRFSGLRKRGGPSDADSPPDCKGVNRARPVWNGPVSLGAGHGGGGGGGWYRPAHPPIHEHARPLPAHPSQGQMSANEDPIPSPDLKRNKKKKTRAHSSLDNEGLTPPLSGAKSGYSASGGGLVGVTGLAGGGRGRGVMRGRRTRAWGTGSATRRHAGRPPAPPAGNAPANLRFTWPSLPGGGGAGRERVGRGEPFLRPEVWRNN